MTAAAGLPSRRSHAPGHLVVTDVPDTEYER